MTGTDIPDPLKTFAQLGDSKAALRMLSNLAPNGWTTPTPIQRQAIPALLADRELLAIAPTGSGKTLAFLLPLLLRLSRLRKTAGGAQWQEGAVKAVVLSPSHELAAQQMRVLNLLLPGSGLRAALLSKATAAGCDWGKVDVLVANPLRLLGLVQEGRLSLAQVGGATYLLGMLVQPIALCVLRLHVLILLLCHYSMILLILLSQRLLHRRFPSIQGIRHDTHAHTAI